MYQVEIAGPVISVSAPIAGVMLSSTAGKGLVMMGGKVPAHPADLCSASRPVAASYHRQYPPSPKGEAMDLLRAALKVHWQPRDHLLDRPKPYSLDQRRLVCIRAFGQESADLCISTPHGRFRRVDRHASVERSECQATRNQPGDHVLR